MDANAGKDVVECDVASPGRLLGRCQAETVHAYHTARTRPRKSNSDGLNEPRILRTKYPVRGTEYSVDVAAVPC